MGGGPLSFIFYLWNEEGFRAVEVPGHVMHHGEHGIVQFFRILADKVKKHFFSIVTYREV
jgi:hypothetical protein